ncbi:hypothetical protein E4U61_000348 [Claviceps capensis]|nr:hypothetical protein E4U61_000348 [Claviceps capensis]
MAAYSDIATRASVLALNATGKTTSEVALLTGLLRTVNRILANGPVLTQIRPSKPAPDYQKRPGGRCPKIRPTDETDQGSSGSCTFDGSQRSLRPREHLPATLAEWATMYLEPQFGRLYEKMG